MNLPKSRPSQPPLPAQARKDAVASPEAALAGRLADIAIPNALAELPHDQSSLDPLPNPLPDSLNNQLPVIETPTEPVETVAQASELDANGVQPAADDRGFLPVLRNRNFLTLWAGQVFSQLADKVYLVLMIALIDTRFQVEGQPISGWVSAIMIAFTIPAVLFGSVAGVYVDRWSKKGVLVGTNLLRGGLVVGLLPLMWIVRDWQPWGETPVGFALMLGVTFLVSTLTQFFAPAEQSVLPLIVEKRHLLSANSLYTTTMMVSVIIGFAVGEPLLALADRVFKGFGVADLGKDWLVGGGYVIAGLILLALRTGEKKEAVDQADRPHVLQDIKDGLSYLGKQPHVRAALIQLVILFSTFAALSVLSVRLAEVMPELKSSQFGFLVAAGGVGMAIGATILGNFGQRLPHKRLGLYGSLGMAAALAGISFVYLNLWLTLGLLATIGGFAAFVGIPMQTVIQQETPEEMRGKVFGLQNNVVNIALSLPLVLAERGEAWLGIQAVFLIMAGLVLAGSLLTWYISRNNAAEEVSL
jgi:MFS family permease